MQDIVLAHRNIVLTHGDIYLHGNQKNLEVLLNLIIIQLEK